MSFGEQSNKMACNVPANIQKNWTRSWIKKKLTNTNISNNSATDGCFIDRGLISAAFCMYTDLSRWSSLALFQMTIFERFWNRTGQCSCRLAWQAGKELRSQKPKWTSTNCRWSCKHGLFHLNASQPNLHTFSNVHFFRKKCSTASFLILAWHLIY